jgi:steroid 5-alpha reductase family enzyme
MSESFRLVALFILLYQTVVFLLALSVKNGRIAILSPLLISFLILRISGVTMREKKYAGNTEFEAYAKRTNAFFPWFPKMV